MDTRHYRKRSQSDALARARWLAWVMVMMFVLVQTAVGATPAAERTQSYPVGRALPQAAADFDPNTHRVTVKAPAPVSMWDATAHIGPRSLVVYEDRVRQPVEDVQLVHTPLSIGVLLEDGGRYHALNEAIAENVSRAVEELMQATEPDDHLVVWTYADGAQPLDLPARDASGLQRTYLNLPVPPSSESNFYDAVLATLPRVQEMPGRKVLLLVSSGVDSFSKARFPDVLRAVHDSGVPVCVINIGPLLRSSLLLDSSEGQPPYSTLGWERASSQLSQLAHASGCRAGTPSSPLEFPAVYDGLLANLRLQYIVHYRSTAANLPGTRQVVLAWVDGLGRRSRVAQGALQAGRSRAFAQARYELAADAVFAGAGALNWLLPNSMGNVAQIPLKPLAATEAQPDPLLAAVTKAEAAARPGWAQGCSAPSCTE